MASKKSQAKKKLVEQDSSLDLPTRKKTSLGKKIAIGALAGFTLFAVTTLALRVAYADRIYPGVWGHGVYLGGLTSQDAAKVMARQTAEFRELPIAVELNDTSFSIAPKDIAANYNNELLSKEVMRLGREGSSLAQIAAQWSLLLGLSGKDNANFTYDSAALAATTMKLNGDIATPAQNAQYTLTNNQVGFRAGAAGKRLSFGAFGIAINERLAQLNQTPINVTEDAVEPAIDNSTLQANQDVAQQYARAPISMNYEGKSWQIMPETILGWLHSASSPEARVYKKNLLDEYYSKTLPEKKLEFDTARIDSYLTEVSKEIDRTAVDAQLNVVDGRATVFVASQDGKKLNVAKTRDSIIASLQPESGERNITMAVDTTKPNVTQESISNLGINELLSEGVSYFPGSSANRLINVRTGARRFNGVLLKPGEVFSFGQLLGPVGPEQGYAKSLIILENKEVEDYGGGLCQVSSTAFRAALLAGLPILERVNHAFAISYYTAPYGVPGVDATIYYPPVDFKFRNDTEAHILIQTEMVGTTLKFRFYGTKKKEGVIRGPYFVTGDMDYNKPSHTVFYRDVVVNGQTIKTDTFNTYYKSALDYPIAPQ